MKIDEFVRRSRRNLEAANLLMKAADADSACNRAYYAMREAARAALCFVGEEEAAFSKTHSGLMTQFNLHLIKTGLLPADLSAQFSLASKRRMVADYEGTFLSEEDVMVVIKNAERFIELVTAFAGTPR